MGLVHRDIKPHNIFLSASRPIVAKLGDFGLTSAASDDAASGFTRRYAPPEVLDGGQAADAAGDVFSFGLVVYETLTLKRCPAVPQRSGGEDYPVPPDLAAVAIIVRWDDGTLEFVTALLSDCWATSLTDRPTAGDIADLFETLWEMRDDVFAEFRLFAHSTPPEGTLSALFEAAVTCGHMSVVYRLPAEAVSPDRWLETIGLLLA